MTQYARGRRKEWDVVKRLRADGWLAQRSAGSHGLWDVVAVKPGHRARLIQVKYSRDGAFRRDENASALLALAANDAVVDVEVWVYRYGRSYPTRWEVSYLHDWIITGGA